MEFLKGEMNDVMMMKFLRRNLATQVEPYTMEHINFLRREMGRMWSKIEHMLLTAWKINLQS